ncbi:ergothioneine biosynthesis protein EgtC [Antrihabitans cavernicola]|uniref:Gamma-glutamyl-hercynylcysteine sulfoxide hydrolase n=1 Tax=Antrihabitans cavernicola TaxID=2495913 RepID=A0A5A7SE42_9NOCA|nr:ergothioneine biosynthesis protein EgtC [Spelaeibacter cavernicola]KAA0023844.1 ergothioneine biosynthesis protein EgtC [Spelaeibacter cavernicola]
MCRHLGYIGPAVPVREPLTRGDHSLRTQSWAPNEMRGGGTINADGFGVAWWRDGAASRYRNPMPIWSDPAVDEVLPQLRSTAVVAAVRSATAGMPVSREACAPFVDGAWAFSHNGVVQNWRTTLAAAHSLELEAPTDSAALWLLLRDSLATAEPAAAIRAVVNTVLAVAPDARLNLLLSNGEMLWATTCYHSLSVLVDDASVTVASEPVDDNSDWQSIPDRSVVIAEPGNLAIESL